MATKSKDTEETTKTSKTATKKAADKPAKKAGEEVQASAKKPASGKSGGTGGKRRPLISTTYMAKWGEYTPTWKLIDAKGQTLGRLSTHIATLLMGKNKPNYTRSADTGDFVVVINAKEVQLTGKKWADKVYKYHTNFVGGLKEFTAGELREKHPERVIERAVWGMLPKGHMGSRWFKKLRVFAGPEHTHTAQQPQLVELPNLGIQKRDR